MTMSSIATHVLLLTGILGGATSLEGAMLLNVTAGPAQSIPEDTGTNVTFTVTNPNASTYILDYALAIITGPRGDDFLMFSSVSFPTLFPFNTPETFTYGVTNFPVGDLSDPDNGLNTISFYIEASPSTPGSVGQFLTANGLGFFEFRSTGGSLATNGPNAQTLADLNACASAPGVNPLNPCPALMGDPHLYDVPGDVTAAVVGTPQPALTTVNLLDAPEPSTTGILALGSLGLLIAWGRRRHGRTSS
jgi:hypothetical protein